MNISPMVSSLPGSHVFFQYDADGDCIMTDAVTGLPITYGGKRSRSASMDDDSTDSRPSKRSRVSTDDEDINISNISMATNTVTICPPAPKKAPRPPVNREDDEDDDSSSLRNLAIAMAEAVLRGEPSDSPVGPWASEPWVAELVSTNTINNVTNAANVPLPESDGEEDWCISVTCSDLALRLDMRHPRVVLHFLRFVKTYNELAPQGEEINVPWMGAPSVDAILDHELVRNPNPASESDAEELRILVNEFACRCPDCDPGAWSYGGRDEDDHDNDSRYPSDSE